MSLPELPAEIETRLDALAKATGHSKSYHACQAILEYLGDLEDLSLAEHELEEIRSGRSEPLPLDVVMKNCGWRIELSTLAQKNLRSFDPPIADRSLRFLHDRVAQLNDPRAVGLPVDWLGRTGCRPECSLS